MGVLSGFLLKRNREYRKKNILPGSKYQRRWVELTDSTFAYAASQQEVQNGAARIYSLSEMLWVRADEGAKFTVRFPERFLTFKAEGADAIADRNRWVEALEAALAKAGSSGAGGGVQSGAGGGAAAGGVTPVFLERLKKGAADSLASSSSAGSSPRIAAITLPAANTADALGGGSGSGRPPSPRSLLANPQLGAVLAASASRPSSAPAAACADGGAARRSGAGGASAAARMIGPATLILTDDGSGDEEEEEDEPIKGHFAHVRSPRASSSTGSRPGSARASVDMSRGAPRGILKTSAAGSARASMDYPPRGSWEVGGGVRQGAAAGANSVPVSGDDLLNEGGSSAAGGGTRLPPWHGAANSGGSVGEASQRRRSLTRVKTPGVLLAAGRASASSSAAGSIPHSPPPSGPLATAFLSADAPIPQPALAASSARGAPPAALDICSDSEEVLQLDSGEQAGGGGGAQSPHNTLPAVGQQRPRRSAMKRSSMEGAPLAAPPASEVVAPPVQLAAAQPSQQQAAAAAAAQQQGQRLKGSVHNNPPAPADGAKEDFDLEDLEAELRAAAELRGAVGLASSTGPGRLW